MKIRRDVIQKQLPWFRARAGKITGSELGNLITDKGKVRDWKTAMPKTYLARKLAEKWRHGLLETFVGSRQTDQGNIYEETARRVLASKMEADIENVGGIESDDERCWCSPDGIIGKATGLEIKCPNLDTHFGRLLEGNQVPEEYVLQCQFGLYISGWQRWVFFEFMKDAPHLTVELTPDLELFDAITEAVEEFSARFDAGWKRLCEMNDGPPPPPPPVMPEPIPDFTFNMGKGWDESSETPS